MKVTTKGQVTIPLEIRQKAGLLPNTEVEFQLVGGKVILRRVPGGSRGRRIVERLRGSATGTVRMSTDEIMRLTRGE
jgi:AbrB family looped-hinge helix DNA binding protein